nr:N-(5'-phosphoribosyl)anthranilate isomerase [Oceanospirillaceae bacterium]
MIQPRVKICGLRNAEDAVHAARCGADAIGLVFYQPSPRSVTPEEAVQITSKLPPFITSVGLFVNASVADIDQIL